MSEVSQNSKQAYRNLLEGCSLTVQLATESKPSNTVVLSTLLSILPLYLGKSIIFKKTLSVFFFGLYSILISLKHRETEGEERKRSLVDYSSKGYGMLKLRASSSIRASPVGAEAQPLEHPFAASQMQQQEAGLEAE